MSRIVWKKAVEGRVDGGQHHSKVIVSEDGDIQLHTSCWCQHDKPHGTHLPLTSNQAGELAASLALAITKAKEAKHAAQADS